MIYNISGNFSVGAEQIKASERVSAAAVGNAQTNTSEQTKQPSYDTFEKTHTYDAEKVNSLKETASAQQTMLKERLMSMISEQTGIYNLSIANKNFQISDEEIEWAKKAIAEGGEFSVDAVATNIMDMAKALSGNDSAYISLLKKAVDMGFSEAEALFGGNMPDITRDTYNEVMKRFDEWEKEFTEAAEAIEDAVE